MAQFWYQSGIQRSKKFNLNLKLFELYTITTDRIKFLIQKRTALKTQITNLTNLVDKNKLDNAKLKLRNARLTELYNAFEEFNDELAVSDLNDAHQEEFDRTLQEWFYFLVGRIENRVNSVNTSGDSISSHETQTIQIITQYSSRNGALN